MLEVAGGDKALTPPSIQTPWCDGPHYTMWRFLHWRTELKWEAAWDLAQTNQK